MAVSKYTPKMELLWRVCEKHEGLRNVDYRVLTLLVLLSEDGYASPKLGRQYLIDRLGINASTLNHSLTRLERAGLVQRLRQYRRVVFRVFPSTWSEVEGSAAQVSNRSLEEVV
jgi:DNA-binding MarR family transcriptional regulator